MEPTATIELSTFNWLTNPRLRACSPAARCLWLDLLCLGKDHPEKFFLKAKNIYPDYEKLGKMFGSEPQTIELLLKELHQKRVYDLPLFDPEGLCLRREGL